jgi:hypothetical protein
MLYKNTDSNHYRGKMGQIEPLRLSDKEEEELSIGLFRDWWIAAIQTMVDEVGSETSLRFLKPYHVNSGRAAAHQIQSIMGYRPTNPGEAMALWNGFVDWIITGGIHRIWTDGKDTAIAEATDCELFKKYGCKEPCILVCRYGGEEGGAELIPGFVLEHTSSEGLGDDKCRWMMTRKGMEPALNCIIPVDIPSTSKELLSYLLLAYFGECWVIVTRAFIDSSGPEKAGEKLTSRARQSGLFVGSRLKKLMELERLDAPSAVRIVLGLESLHQMKCAIELGNDFSQGSINECPFSDSPIEICVQYEAFFNGVFAAISPGFEFTYDRMMTKGDKTCHWTIRKKGKPSKEKTEEAPTDDPFKRLANKLIDGQITEEEFARKMALLKEHYPR